MPDRIIRDELLESEKWLSLKDNADRLAFIALLLKADSLGNFSAEPFRLMRLWRDFGINTISLVAKTLCELSDHDLVRPYQVSDKQLLHIPRFRQRLRYLSESRNFPISPWTTDEQKQILAKNSPDSHLSVTRHSPPEVKRSEVELPLPSARKNRASAKKLNGDTPEAKATRLATWHSYSTAYFNRYGTEPLRNAQSNSLISKFCQSVASADAPNIAAFYVAHNKYSYTNSKHDLKLMVACAPALHTDWKTGQQSTDSQARKLDQGQAQGSVWAKLQAEGKP